MSRNNDDTQQRQKKEYNGMYMHFACKNEVAKPQSFL